MAATAALAQDALKIAVSKTERKEHNCDDVMYTRGEQPPENENTNTKQ